MPETYSIVVPIHGEISPLSKLFFFEPQHVRFLVGKDRFVGSSSYIRALLLPGILAGLVLLVGFAQPDIFAITLLLALGFGLVGLFNCWQVFRNRQLSQKGKVIQGRIVDYQAGKSVRVGMLFNVVWQGEYWGINALCGFRTPTGKTVSRRIKMQRNDLINQDMKDGTPIAVLYLNDSNYKIL